MKRRPHEQGFSLIESVIAVAILGVSLGALLQTQVSSINNAAVARDWTIATLLLRSKMIDIEQQLFDEGFEEGVQDESGDFSDEGYPKIKWEATISEIDFDLSMIEGFMGGLEGEEGGSTFKQDSTSAGLGIASGMGGAVELFTNEITQSIRLVELKVIWPVGDRYTDDMSVRTIVSREEAPK